MSPRRLPPPRAALLDALGRLQAASAPGYPIGIGEVAVEAGLERDDAIRLALELMEEESIDGSINRGDDEVKSINGLQLLGTGRRELGRQRATRFMLGLEETTGGDPDAASSASGIGAAFGWSAKEADAVTSILEDDGLIESIETGSDLVRMTAPGRRQLDRAAADEEAPGQPLAAVVYVAGDVVGSQLQAGTVGSTQQQSVSITSQKTEVAAFVAELRRLLPEFELEEPERVAIEADLVGVEAQLESPRPNEGILREGLRSLRSLAEGVAGNAAFAGLVELAGHIQL
jgi:hypothetical protein